MRPFLFLALLAFLIPPIPQAHSMARVSPDVGEGSFLRLGSGYDTLSDNAMANCIEFDGASDLDTGSASVTTEFELIESYQALAKALEISASGHLKMGWASGSATTNYYRRQTVDSDAIYIMFKISVISPVKMLDNPRIKQSSLEHFKAAALGSETFRKRCGDHYVNSIRRGGKLYMLLKVFARDETDKRVLSAMAKGKFGSSGSFSVNISSSVTEVIGSRHYSIFFHQEGGLVQDYSLEDIIDHKDVDPAKTSELVEQRNQHISSMLKQIFAQTAKFQETIIKTGGGVTLEAQTESYEKLDNYPYDASPFDIENQKYVVLQLSEQKFEFRDRLAQLDTMINYPEMFLYLNDENEWVEWRILPQNSYAKYLSLIQEIRNTFIENLKMIDTAARGCFVNIEKCLLPEYSLVSMPQNIKPKETNAEVSQTYRLARSVACGVEKYQLIRDAECGVESYKSGRSAVCGIETYKSKVSKYCGLKRFVEKRDKKCGIDIYAEANVGLPTRVYSAQTANAMLKKIKSSLKKQIMNSCHLPGGKIMPLAQIDDLIAQECFFTSGTGDFSCVSCIRYKTCRDSDFGSEYNSCRHPEHGVGTYKLCRDKSFGVEQYKQCRLEKAGVELYKECRHPSHGLE